MAKLFLVFSKDKSRATVAAFPLSLILISLTLLCACGGGGSVSAGNVSSTLVLTTISVSPTVASVVVGGTRQFQVIAKDQHGAVMSGATFAFSSSGGAATVDNSGLAKGMLVGTAMITASADGVSASVPLTVVADPALAPVLTQISVSPSTALIKPGQQQSYTAVGFDQFNNVMSGIAFTWSSDGSSSIAILNGNVATGAGPGTTHITASALGITSAPASLTVMPSPSSLTTIVVTPSTSAILIGGSQQLTAVGYDQNGAAMSGITFAWSSTNTNVAPVSSAGLANGVGAGTVQITNQRSV
jgi:Bacterial Ig-like domain (group 2)